MSRFHHHVQNMRRLAANQNRQLPFLPIIPFLPYHLYFRLVRDARQDIHRYRVLYACKTPIVHYALKR